MIFSGKISVISLFCQTIKDKQLLVIISVLAAVVLVVVVVWEILAPHKTIIKVLDNEVKA